MKINNRILVSPISWVVCMAVLCMSHAQSLPLFDNHVSELNIFSWSNKAEITFSGYTGTETLTNFPALVVLGPGTIAGFAYDDCQDGGADIRFTDSTGTVELPYEIEQWNPAGDSLVWVRVPELVDADTSIWVYWGNPSVVQPAYATDGSAWDMTFAAVWHMNQPNCPDSSGNGNHATAVGAGVAAASGCVGGGVDLGGGYLSVPNHASLSFSAPTISVTGLVRPTSIGGESSLLRKDDHYQLGMMSTTLLRHLLRTSGDTGWTANNDTAFSTPLNAWTQHGFVYQNGVGLQYYANGVALGSPKNVSGNVNPSTNPLGLGASGGGGTRVSGALDEIRIENVARSASWMGAFWENIAENGSFQTYGAAESAVPGAAVVVTGLATNVATSSAWLCGNLVSTGASDTVVIACWGASDGGTNAVGWASSAVLAGPQSEGEFSVQATGLSADSTYYFRMAASNEVGLAFAKDSASFITGEVSVEKTADADENGLVTGSFTLRRPTSCSTEPLTVFYEIGGTAVAGTNYEDTLGASATFGAGVSSLSITVTPINVWDTQTDTTVVLTILDGPHILGASSSATLNIVNRVPPTGPLVYHVNPATGDNSRSALDAINPDTPWKSITYALAQVESNDVIQVSAGTCSPTTGETFPINIPAGVTLRGSDIFKTLVSVNAAKTALVLNAAHGAILERLTITGMQEPGDNIYSISVLGGGSPLIQDVCIQGNHNSRGNGYSIHVNGASPTFRNCLVAGNAAGYLAQVQGATSAPVFENCTFAGNWGNNGGFHRAAGTPTLRDCIFWRNRFEITGMTTANSVISNCLFQSGAFNGTNGCFKTDPQLLGGYFLPQAAAGQTADSPAVNVGSRTVAEAGLAGYTVRTDGVADDGIVDLGFHFPPGTVAGAEVYVSVAGSDTTGNGTAAAPWRTITKALRQSTHGTVVHVADGFYQAGEIAPMSVPDGVSLIGQSVQKTVISRTANGAIVSLQDASWQRLENFTIQDSNASDWSCGIYIARSAPDVRNCIVRRNIGIWRGYGGIYCNNALPRFGNLLVTGNFNTGGSGGGGIGLYGCLAELSNATIVGNVCRYGKGEGIIASGIDSRTIIRDSIVWGNGVSDVTGLSEGNVLNCLFDQGAFDGTNGCFKADPMLTRGYYLSSIAAGDEADSPAIGAGSRTAAEAGLAGFTTRIDGVADDGVVNLGFHLPAGETAGPVLYVDIVNGNDGNDGLSPSTALKTIKTALPKTSLGSIVNVAPGSYSKSTGDLPPFSVPDGVDLIGSGWTNTTIYANGGNGSFQISGAVRSRVSGFTVRGATAGDFSGAFYLWKSHLLIENCRLTDNVGLRHAGGVHCEDGSSPTIRNCIVDLNRINDAAPRSGGGISVGSGRPVVENCTIISNNVGRTNPGSGIALRSTAFPATIRNNIVRGNGSDDLDGVTAAMIRNTHVGDGEFDGVNDCFDDVPTFESIALRDYRLTRKSPFGLDAGVNLPWMEGATDLAGNPRIQNKFSDVGAFETWFPPSATLMLVR